MRPGPSIDLSDQRGRWTIVYFYPTDDTPGCTVEACEFRDSNDDDPRARRRRVGHQPAGRSSQARTSARSSTCRSPSSPMRTTRSPRPTARGSRSRTTARRTGASPGRTFLVDPEGRIARVWPKVKPEGHAAEVLAALDELQAARPVIDRPEREEASLVGETSEASADEAQLRRRRRPHAGRPPTHTWRPARFMVIAGPSRRRRLRAGGHRRALDRRGLGRLARVLHQRRPGRRGPRRRSARAGRPARDRAAGRGRDHRLRRRDVPPPARRRAGQRPRPARAARPRDPDLPARRRPRHRPRRRSSTATAGSTTPTIARPGIAAVDAVYPAARNPMAFPWLARAGLAAHRVRRLYLFWSNRADTWVDVSAHARAQDRRPARPRQPDPRPRRRSADRIRVVGGRGGRSRSGWPRPRRSAWWSSTTTRTRVPADGGSARRTGRRSGLLEQERPDAAPLVPELGQAVRAPAEHRDQLAEGQVAGRCPRGTRRRRPPRR